jgi:hypothetical protein
VSLEGGLTLAQAVERGMMAHLPAIAAVADVAAKELTIEQAGPAGRSGSGHHPAFWKAVLLGQLWLAAVRRSALAAAGAHSLNATCTASAPHPPRPRPGARQAGGGVGGRGARGAAVPRLRHSHHQGGPCGEGAWRHGAEDLGDGAASKACLSAERLKATGPQQLLLPGRSVNTRQTLPITPKMLFLHKHTHHTQNTHNRAARTHAHLALT